MTFYSYGIKGKRPTMEDETFHIEWGRGIHYFGVLDGHGGAFVAAKVKSILPAIMHKQYKRSEPRASFVRAFDETHRVLEHSCRTRCNSTGSTACTVLIDGDSIYCINVGDSRAVLLQGVFPVQISRDHKPSDPREKAHIESLGGTVTKKPGDTTRAWPSGLSTSRSFGDFDSKVGNKYTITHRPEVSRITRSPQDVAIIVGCDGVWDVMSNLEACAVVARSLQNNGNPAKDLVRNAYARGSTDNISVVIHVFAKNK
jgi:serine/threonine protein phosphatase PrpC